MSKSSRHRLTFVMPLLLLVQATAVAGPSPGDAVPTGPVLSRSAKLATLEPASPIAECRTGAFDPPDKRLYGPHPYPDKKPLTIHGFEQKKRAVDRRNYQTVLPRVAQFPRSPKLQLSLARYAGSPDTALPHHLEAVRLHDGGCALPAPDLGRALVSIVRGYEQKQDLERALAWLLRRLAEGDRATDLRSNVAEIYCRLADREQCLAQLEQLAQEPKGARDLTATRYRSRFCVLHGDPRFERLTETVGREAGLEGTREAADGRTTEAAKSAHEIHALAGSFAWIRAGQLRSPLESKSFKGPWPETKVTLDIAQDFYLGATEVTQKQWQSLMGTNPSRFTACGDHCPVEQVSWYDALAYCNARSRHEGFEPCYDLSGCRGQPGVDDVRCPETIGFSPSCLGYRLPTEAEWVYASQAGADRACFAGSPERKCSDDVLNTVAWYAPNTHRSPRPVAGRRPNRWGVYDVSGNVAEWVWDRYARYVDAKADPVGPDSGRFRVTKGCSWANGGTACRVAQREPTVPWLRSAALGFRVVRTAQAP